MVQCYKKFISGPRLTAVKGLIGEDRMTSMGEDLEDDKLMKFRVSTVVTAGKVKSGAPANGWSRGAMKLGKVESLAEMASLSDWILEWKRMTRWITVTDSRTRSVFWSWSDE